MCFSVLTFVGPAKHYKTLSSCRWLLRCAAVPVTTRNARGETCAHLAAKHGHVTCLRLIVFCGSERPLVLTAGGDRQGLTPAHLAAILGHAHVVRWLVNTFGLPVAMAANNLGQTPLHFAAAKGEPSSGPGH